LFDRALIGQSIFQGASLLAAIGLLHAWQFSMGVADGELRALVFAAVVFGNVGLILCNRSRNATISATLWSRNPALWWLIVAALAGLFMALFLDPVTALFRFAHLGAQQLLLSAAAAVVGLAPPELYKWLRVRSESNRVP
jgi:hypothetical protein